MPQNTMLSIRPDYELVTRYGAAWMGQILNAATIPVVDLYGSQATASNFFSNIEAHDPLVINLLGHGDYHLMVVQNNELLLQSGVNDDVLAGRIVFDLSCRSGKQLGASAINKGALAFLGYTENFYIPYSFGNHSDGGMVNPLADEAAQGSFESHNAAVISYFQDQNLKNAYFNSQKTHNYWIEVWNAIDSQVAAYITWNRDHQIMRTGEGVITSSGGGLLPLVALAAIPFIIKKLKKKKKKK